MDWIKKAERLLQLPPYLFLEIDRLKAEVQAKGVDIIDLGVGDPDLPTPAHILQRLLEAARDPRNHRYPSYSGMNDFRKSVADWYRRRFNVALDPVKEVVTLIGSKEGIAHFPLAFINPGDFALMSSPGYPVYFSGTLFAGGRSHFLPLRKENDFLPDLSQIPEEVAPGGPNCCSSTIRTTPRRPWPTALFLSGWLPSPGNTGSSSVTMPLIRRSPMTVTAP